ncbi:MAG: stage III sporulation protein AB [Clostridia bacterium]|nr:stage III sporulation protein AB [Clostridia bacterium]
MLRLFKFTGLLLVFCACTCAGLYKSYLLKKRAEKLSRLYKGLNSLSERIRCKGGEIGELLPSCFENELISVKNGVPFFRDDFLASDDIALLEEFFSAFGMGSTTEEYERTKLFASLLEKQCQNAEKNCSELCRLYGTTGVLCGIFICIFFL